MKQLRLPELIASRPSRERDLVLAMIAARVLEPDSKLATSRWWQTTTIPEEFGVADATEDDLYRALDWLGERQQRIEQKLASRHLSEGGLALYDLTAVSYEGKACPLAARGHGGEKGKLVVKFGLVTDGRGCPVEVTVHPGNTADSETFLDEVRRVRREFKLGTVAVVGDRGTIGTKQIRELGEEDDLAGIGWITALKGSQVRKLVEDETIQPSLFDQRNLMELFHPDYPGERLIVCLNPLVGQHRARTRTSLIAATERELRKVQGMVERGRLLGKDKIGVRVGRVVDRYKVAKHFDLVIEEAMFSFEVNHQRVAEEAALDGLYVIRTSLPAKRLTGEDAVQSYKLLSQVEQAFRSLKSLELLVGPVFHRLEERVRAHIFLCMLAYYVQWHMKEAWRELLWRDEEPEARWSRDPVAPAVRSERGQRKVQRKRLEDGSEIHSFRTLLAELSTIVRNTCRRQGAGPKEATFPMVTIPNPSQHRALDLLQTITL
jgi:transposase